MPGMEDRMSKDEEYRYLYQIWKDYNAIAEEGEEAILSIGNPPTLEGLKIFFNNHIISEEFREKMYFFNGTIFPGYEKDREKFDLESDDNSDSDINGVQNLNPSTISDSESDEQMIRDIEKQNSEFQKLSKKVEDFLQNSYKRFPPSEGSKGFKEKFKTAGMELCKRVEKFIKKSDQRMKEVEETLKNSKSDPNIDSNKKPEEDKSSENNNIEVEDVNILTNWIILLDKDEFERDGPEVTSVTVDNALKCEPTCVTETYNLEPDPLESPDKSPSPPITNTSATSSKPQKSKNAARKTSGFLVRKKRKINEENHGTFKSKKSKDNENPFTNFLDESDVDDEKYTPRSQGFTKRKIVNPKLESDDSLDFFINENTNSTRMSSESQLNSDDLTLKKSRKSLSTLEKELKRLRDPKDEPIREGRRRTLNSSFQKVSDLPDETLTENLVKKMFEKFKVGKAKYFPPSTRGNEVLVKKSEKEAFKFTQAKTIEGYKVYTCPYCKDYGKSVRAIYELKTSYLRYDDDHIASCPVVPWPL